tara:strand:- start:19 stop:327 length:309 start_codon:yes stop_codon:yes gene_type:complete
MTDRLHHVAIQVTDIPTSVDFYKMTFNAKVEYQDDTWALLNVRSRTRLALVLKSKHPPHIAFVSKIASLYKNSLVTHRDGTRSKYINDPSGNVIEILDPTSL